MRILRLKLENLNSLRGRVELDFTKEPFTHSGLFAVTGDTGAGKTTLLDALTLALFGKTSRNHAAEVMSYGSFEAWAEVEFAAADGIFRAKWQQTRDKKGELKAPYRELARQIEGGVFEILSTQRTKLDGTKDEKGLLEKTCGLNFEQFRRSVMLAQGDFAAFVKADEKERSALLERLTDTEIYSRLSKAAYEKYKLENTQLADFQKERDMLRLLDAEEIANLKAEGRQQNEHAQALKTQLETLRTTLAQLENLEKIRQRKTEIEAAVAGLADEKTAFSPALARLESHRQTTPFSAQVARLRELAEEGERLRGAASQIDISLLENQSAAERVQAEFFEKEAALKNLEVEARQLESVFDRVIRLDEQIAGQQASFQKLEAELVDFQAKRADWEQQQGAKTGQLAEAEKQISQANDWLTAHPHAAQLPADLPLAEKHVELLRTIFSEKKSAAEKLAALQKRRSELENEQVFFQKNAEKAASELTEKKAALQKLLLENALPADQTEAEIELDHRNETASAQLQSLDDFIRHHAQYRQAIRDLGAVREEQANLLIEDFSIGKELLNALDLLGELEEKTALKRRRYELEQLKINYLRDRQHLETGQPCPLCGSLEHPYALHETETYLDDASAELHAVQVQLEAARQHQQVLASRHLQIRDRVGAVQDEFDDLMTAQMLQLLERIAEQERSIGKILPNFKATETDGEADFEAREDLLLEKSAALRTETTLLRSARERLNLLSRDIREAEKRSFEADSVLKNHFLQADLHRAEILGEEKRVLGFQNQFENEEQALNAVLKKHDLVFSPTQEFRQQFSDLKLLENQFSQHRKVRDELSNQLEILKNEIAAADRQLAERTAELDRKAIFFQKEKSALEGLRGERLAIFGEKSPREERAAMLEKLDAGRRELADLQTVKQEKTSRLAALTAEQSGLRKQLEDGERRTEATRTEVEKSLRKTGFGDVEALLAAVLPDEEVAEIETRQAELLRRETELAQSLRETELALAAELKTSAPDADPEALRTEMAAAEKDYQTALQRIGGIKNQLNENEKRAVESKELLAKIAAQKREVERWSKLKDLIGSADGALFRRFAQSLTLEQLVFHANQHLTKLNGRYLIRRKTSSDLDLEIIDTYLADNVRSMNTLSGGEIFLVSLALALGLSDLAGRKTRISSLFIDEGFGALDESALELAITTLENLQARGTMIGIISHIRELKERIAVQVQVNKRSDGFSEVAVLG